MRTHETSSSADRRANAGADQGEAEHAPTSRKLLWFALLWLAGLAVVGTLAFLLRLVLL